MGMTTPSLQNLRAPIGELRRLASVAPAREEGEPGETQQHQSGRARLRHRREAVGRRLPGRRAVPGCDGHAVDDPDARLRIEFGLDQADRPVAADSERSAEAVVVVFDVPIGGLQEGEGPAVGREGVVETEAEAVAAFLVAVPTLLVAVAVAVAVLVVLTVVRLDLAEDLPRRERRNSSGRPRS